MDSSLVSEEFAMLLEQHAGILWKVAFTWCQQNADREDLAQEIRLQLWRAFDRYDRSRPFSTWMYRVALNVAISGHRQRRREKQNRLPWDSIQEPAMPHADAEMTRRSEELRGTIESLPDLDRALLLLYLEGLSHQQMEKSWG